MVLFIRDDAPQILLDVGVGDPAELGLVLPDGRLLHLHRPADQWAQPLDILAVPRRPPALAPPLSAAPQPGVLPHLTGQRTENLQMAHLHRANSAKGIRHLG